MSGVNKVILVGRLGKDPEVRDLDNGSTVANFNLATSESYKDRTTGEKKETTEWHNVICWKGLADIASKYLHKGDNVITRYVTEIVADSMQMLSSKSNQGRQQPDNTSGGHSAKGHYNNAENNTDDLPF